MFAALGIQVHARPRRQGRVKEFDLTLIKRAKLKFAGELAPQLDRPFALVSRCDSPRLLHVMSPMSPSFDLQLPRKHQKMGMIPGSSMVEHSAVKFHTYR